MSIADSVGSQIQQPRFCGGCGKELIEDRLPTFDRLTGERREDSVERLYCRNGDEVWGLTGMGTWLLVDKRRIVLDDPPSI